MSQMGDMDKTDGMSKTGNMDKTDDMSKTGNIYKTAMKSTAGSVGRERIILASGSPRRRELLSGIGLEYEVIVSREEENIEETDPARVVELLSERKAMDVAEHLPQEYESQVCIILGADTVVAVDGEILGKPADEADAVRMIEKIAGDTHRVYTGVTLIRKTGGIYEEHTFSECTEVSVYDMDHREIEAYVATGEPMDKAGAYAIQGLFGKHIRKINGDYTNVVGLPVGRVYRELRKNGWIAEWRSD